MKPSRWIVAVFAIAAAYDGVLGLLFLAAPGLSFELFDVTPPNHMGYVQFPAALLLIFAWMFAAVAMDPIRNRSLILYGIGLKVAYCTVCFWYWFTADIPIIWKPFAVIDVAMGVLFAWSYVALGPAGTTRGTMEGE
jgi:hypothetical protein